ncbi:MAG: PilZ domain-containing protein [Terriglobales bacterium]
MDKRPETRVATVILVRAWGMDADGRPFFQNANATNLSSEGARILGISHPLKSGDVIGVQHEEKKARFKVIWVIDSGVARQIEAGVQVLPNQQVPWQALTKNDKVAIAPGKNKRRYVRHKVLFPLEIGFEDSRRTHMQTNATDIGGRGCYVETLLPLSIGTKVKITFWMDSEKIHTSGVVRASDGGVGMGIEFTQLDNHVQDRLQKHLDKLDEGLKSRDAAKGASNAES